MIENNSILQNKSEKYSSLRPQIIHYNDYRKYLRDYYLFKKSLGTGFSFRQFSRLAGISSPNYLQLVMNGKRNLSVRLAEKIADVLLLSTSETDYFITLVELSISDEEKQENIRNKQSATLKKLVSKHVPQNKIRILNEWHHLVIREMTSLQDFNPSGLWISKKLRGLITAEQAEESLSIMISAGFLKVENNCFLQTEPSLDFGENFGETCILNIHKAMLAQWRMILEKTDPEQRELGLLNIPIAKNKIPELKKKIQDFQDEIINWLQYENNPQELVQLGTYLIPLSDPLVKK